MYSLRPRLYCSIRQSVLCKRSRTIDREIVFQHLQIVMLATADLATHTGGLHERPRAVLFNFSSSPAVGNEDEGEPEPGPSDNDGEIKVADDKDAEDGSVQGEAAEDDEYEGIPSRERPDAMAWAKGANRRGSSLRNRYDDMSGCSACGEKLPATVHVLVHQRDMSSLGYAHGAREDAYCNYTCLARHARRMRRLQRTTARGRGPRA